MILLWLVKLVLSMNPSGRIETPLHQANMTFFNGEGGTLTVSTGSVLDSLSFQSNYDLVGFSRFG